MLVLTITGFVQGLQGRNVAQEQRWSLSLGAVGAKVHRSGFDLGEDFYKRSYQACGLRQAKAKRPTKRKAFFKAGL